MMNYMTSKTPLPPYMPFPRFLLDMDLSETSRLLYSVLLDRARISQGKKKWTDRNGYVFLIYPIKALAESIHKSEMTVKTALSSLEKHDLIFRVRRGVGQPNLIYVKIPEDVPEGSLHSKDPLFVKQTFIPSSGSPLSDTDNHSFSQSETFPSKGQINVCTAEKNLSISEKKNLTSGGLKTGCSEDKNLSFSHKESFPSEGQETLCHADRKVSGNNNNIIKQIETNNRSDINKPHSYGPFQNVFLSSTEMQMLKTTVPDYHKYINRLSGYMASTGKNYSNHAATILNWAQKDNASSPVRTYTCNEGESL